MHIFSHTWSYCLTHISGNVVDKETENKRNKGIIVALSILKSGEFLNGLSKSLRSEAELCDLTSSKVILKDKLSHTS